MKLIVSSLVFLAVISLCTELDAKDAGQRASAKVAVSLSYDDALDSQLDYAVPTLDKAGLKASFYVVPTADAFRRRFDEWKALAVGGHELGNHTLLHSCRGSLDGREWVQAEQNLDSQTPTRVATEVKIANTLLRAMDGQLERTFTIPCGDTLAGGKDYIDSIKSEFVAIKGQGVGSGFASLHVAVGDTGADLIDYVKQQSQKVKLINILFHGVGADHLSVTAQAHAELVNYLADNQDKYWVDTYVNIMRHENSIQAGD